MKIEVHKSDEMGNVYRLLEPLTYENLTVPEGFESDGASVPRFFWRIVFPPAITVPSGPLFCTTTFTGPTRRAGLRPPRMNCSGNS